MTREAFVHVCRERWKSCATGAALRVEVGGTVASIPYRELEEACAKTTANHRRGEPGDVVLLLLPHSVELFLLHLGLMLDGKCPAILAWPTSKVDPGKYVRNLVHQLRFLPADRLVTIPELAGHLESWLPYPVESCPISSSNRAVQMFSELATPSSPAHADSPQASPRRLPDDTLFLQFSGGTTGVQKCVPVTATMLEQQLERLREAMAIDGEDGVVSWLPLYHDMGLIACLWFPLWCGISSFHMSPGDWVMQPERLFQYLEKYRATLCWLPNFAFSYLAQRRRSIRTSYSLNHVRGWISCSEPVRFASLDEFASEYADWGVTRSALQASYALAENVFAVTQTSRVRLKPDATSSPEEMPRTVRREDVKQQAAATRVRAFDLADDVYVSSGRLLTGMDVRIVRSDGGAVCERREAGEIQLRTPCLFDGYWNTASPSGIFSADDWYSTGDYGFLSDGELYVIGRFKDIIIVGGQNVFPEDVESLVNVVAGVHPGRAVAFGVDDEELGTQAIAVLAEMDDEFDGDRAAAIEKDIRKAILASITIAPRWVRVVPRHWIVKSTAGKISRTDTRQKFLDERFQLAR